MDMNEIVSTVITTLPNLAIAVWVLIQYQKTIDKLLDNQQKLLDQLMALHPPQDVMPLQSKCHLP